MSGFVIFEIEAGGGCLGLCPLPGKSGSYRADLEVLTAWSPDLVLSMTQTAELAAAAAGDLGRDLGQAGILWRQLAIRDFGAPGGDVVKAWPAVSAQARAILAGGGRVVAHCRGGCGRSGMVVLRLMTELGEPAEVALARLRAVRPCAVETDDQYRWAALARAP